MAPLTRLLGQAMSRKTPPVKVAPPADESAAEAGAAEAKGVPLTEVAPMNWDYGDRPVLDCLVAYNRYGGYVVPRHSAHRVAARKILGGQVYEPGTIDLLRGECGEGDIVHAGTFFGDFLPALSGAMAPSARIYAFEPNPVNFRCASLTLSLNGIENVSLACAGLGAEAGHAAMLVTRKDGSARGGSSRVLKEGDPADVGNTIQIPITTVDDSVPLDRRVSILQLDLEGYEQHALDGAMATIRRCRPVTIVETLDPGWIADNLAPIGYRRAGRVHYNTVLRVT